MKNKTHNRSVLLTTLFAVWLAAGISSAPAEEVFYLFDLDNNTLPDVLQSNTWTLANDRMDTLDYEVSDGQLRVFNTMPAASGLFFYPGHSLTDTYMSAVFDVRDGSCFLSARDTGAVNIENYDNYDCWLSESLTAENAFVMGIEKGVNGQVVYSRSSGVLLGEGPFLMEFDVVDRETPEGVPYTSVEARVTYNEGQKTFKLYAYDFGLGGYPPLTAGDTLFGAFANAGQRDNGVVLDVGIDDVMIRGTVVPEPTALALLFSGILVCGLFHRRASRELK